MKSHSLLILCILVLALLLLACQLEGGGDSATATPVPAQDTGMSAINRLEAEGLKPDCDTYPVWMGCSPAGQSVPVREMP